VKNEVRFQRKLNPPSAQCKRIWYITKNPERTSIYFVLLVFLSLLQKVPLAAMPPWLKPVLRRTLDRRRSSGEEQL
jgi:hypothetical protein